MEAILGRGGGNFRPRHTLPSFKNRQHPVHGRPYRRSHKKTTYFVRYHGPINDVRRHFRPVLADERLRDSVSALQAAAESMKNILIDVQMRPESLAVLQAIPG